MKASLAAAILSFVPVLAGSAAPDAISPAISPVISTAAGPGRHADAPGIEWFAGDVDAAFAEAARSRKPVLLYWGASWCPPCQQLKLTVFARPDFIAKSHAFVPVYLDGDSEGAQKWGEQFRVTGYPTLVVLDAGRQERMRISGGMDLRQYAAVLDLALADLEPVEQLLASQRPLERGECRRLAWNAWLLSDIDVTGRGLLSDQLMRAAGRCRADELSAARLLLNATWLASTADGAHTATGTDHARLAARVADVAALLARPKLATEVGDALYYLDPAFFGAVRKRGAAFAQRFETRFTGIAVAAGHDPRFAVADQIDILATQLRLQIALHDAPDPALVKSVRLRIAAELLREQRAYARSALINSALHVYDVLDDRQSAYDLVRSELPRATPVYYLKSDLADIAESLGRKEEALTLYREAWTESQGTATRFQWGYDYLTALLRLRPDDGAAVTDAGQQLLAELAGNDRIYRRVRIRLERLDAALRQWQSAAPAARAPVLEGLRSRMQSVCAAIPAADAAHRSCAAFLAGPAG